MKNTFYKVLKFLKLFDPLRNFKYRYLSINNWLLFLDNLYKKLYQLNIFVIEKKSNKPISFFKKELSHIFQIKLDKTFEDKCNKYFENRLPMPKSYKELENECIKSFSYKYVLDPFPGVLEHLDNYIWVTDIDRQYYANFLEENLGNEIRKIYNGSNYRIEQIYLYETCNFGSETEVKNHTFHKDYHVPGSTKILIYLDNVDDDNGPFKFYKENNKSDIKTVKGNKGTTICFANSLLMHSGSNTKKRRRRCINYQIFPSIRKKIFFQKKKAYNVLFTKNPFTNIS